MTSRSRLFVALAFVAAAAATVFGVTAAQGDPTCDVNWDVAGSGSWGVGSNWDTGAVPTSEQHACVNALSAATVVVDQSFNVAALDIAAPITLHVNGGGAFNHITFTVTGSVTNHGVIRLESSNGGYESSLSAGTLGNAPDGTFEVKPGPGGPRTFTGALDNQGTLRIFGGATLGLAGGTTNVSSGSIVVDSGAALVLGETAGTLHQTGGSMTNAGHIGVTNGTLKLDGGTILGTPPQVFHGTLAFSAGSPATGPVSVGGDSVLQGDIPAGTTVWVQGGMGSAQTNLTSASAFTNHGTVKLESINGGYQSHLTVTTGTFTNAGALQINHGAGGSRTISAAVDNQATLNVADGVTLTVVRNPGGSGVTHLNSGSIVVGANALLHFPDSGDTFRQTAGSMTGSGGVIGVSNDGFIGVSGSTLKLDGGSVVGRPPQVFNGTLAFSAGSPATGSVIVAGNSVLQGDIPAGLTVWVQGGLTGTGAQANLTSATGFTNHGTLKLESTNGGYQSHLTVTTGTFTNAGTLQVNPGTGGSRNISAAVDNQATLNVADGIILTVVGNPGGTGVTHLNSGSIVVGVNALLHLTDANDTMRQTGGSMTSSAGVIGVSNDGLIAVSGGRLKLDGGTIVGTPLQVFHGTLAFSANSPATGPVIVGGISALQGDIPAGIAVWVKGGLGFGQANLTSASGFTNHGTLKLESINGAYQSHLTVTTGTFTNAATGTLRVNQGSTGSRDLNATLDNQGRVEVGPGTTLTLLAGRTHTNSGTIANDGVITVNFGSFAQTDGSIENRGSFTVTNAALRLLGGRLNQDTDFQRLAGTNDPVSASSILELHPDAHLEGATLVLGGESVLQGDIPAGTTVWVQGGLGNAHTNLTSATGFTNRGTVKLESINGAYQSHLIVTTGTFTNAGALQINQGAGGSRNISAAVDNQATLNVADTVTLTLVGNPGGSGVTHLNSGSIVVGASALLHLTDARDTLRQTGGGLATNPGVIGVSNDGLIAVSGGRLKLDGGSIIGAPAQVFHGTLAFSSGSPATGAVNVGGNSALQGDIPAGIAVWVQGGMGNAHTNLTSATAFTNRGALKLESINGAYQSHLTVTTGTFTNAGALQINLGAGGSRNISAAVDNQATWNIADGIGLTLVGNPGGSGVTHLNSGSIVVGSTGLLHLTDALDTLRQTAGNMTSNAGLIAVSGGRLKLDGGTIVGTPLQVFHGTLAFSASSPATGAVNVGGTSALQGDIPAGIAVWVQGGMGHAQTNLTSATAFTNHGTLKLESINGAYQSHLTVTTGAFANAGTLQSNQGAGGSNHLNASTIDNSGFIVLDGDAHLSTSLSPAPTITNRDVGTINKTGLAGAATLYLPVDNFGTITVGAGELHLQGGLVSYNATSRTLERGSYVLGGVLRFPGADVVTNNATLIFLGPPSALRSSAGADGLAGFAANGLSGGLNLYGRALNTAGAFTNAGTVTVNAGSSLVTTGNYTQTAGETSLTDATATLTATASLVDIQGGALSGLGTVAPALRINGTVGPGESPGVLTVDGDYTQTAGGVMIADIAGILAADYDRLVVSGTATIDGTLELNTDPVYSPLMAAGTTHRVIAANALVGVFASVENVEPFANGRYFDIDYDRVPASGVDLVVTERTVTLTGPATVDENLPGGNATYTLTLSAPSRFATTVAYTVDDVTTNAADHGAGLPASPMTIAVGATTATINVPITNDTTDEFDQAYAVELGTASNTIPVDPARVETTIVDDDLPPLASVSGGGSVGEAAGPASFTLTLSEASEKPITVGYTVDDISTTGDDHGSATPDISAIAPSATTATVTVPVVNDTTDEPDQVMRLRLLGGTDVRLHPTAIQADATIVDEDLPPTVAVTAAPTPVNEAAGNATFTLSLSERSEKHLVVFYNVEDDTTSPADRGVATPNPVGINPGGLTGKITVPIVNDTTDEPDQAFRVRLTSGVDVRLDADPLLLTRAVTITDNDLPPTASVAVAPAVDESAGNATFTVSLSERSEWPITVNWALENGTASDADHGAGTPASPVAIAAGATSATITVPIVDDEIDDNDEAFGVRVTGGSNVTVGAPAAASVTIIDDDLTPIAVDGPVSTDEDNAAVVTFVATDADSPSLTYTVTAGPGHGTLGPVVGSQVTYTPDGNFNGTDSIRFTASDGANTSAEAVVAITVVAVNDAPMAANSSATVAEDSPGPVVLSGSDIDSGTLTYSVVTGPTHGTLTGGTGTARTYTPAANYSGSDSFTFKTNDGSLNSTPATVSLTVTPVNDAPVAVDDVFAVSVGASVDLAVTANDTDSDSSTLVATAAGSADHGVTLATGVATVHYTADSGYVGDDTFTYTVSDGAGGTANGTVLIHVGAAPAAQNGSASTAEDTPVIVSLQASDPDGAPLTYQVVSGPTRGTLGLVTGNQVTYTPTANLHGSDSFTFKANNGGFDSNAATVNITVTAVNDVPVAAAGSPTVAEDGNLAITMAASDVDLDALTYSVVTAPTHGTLTGGTGAARTYTPAADYNGPDSFTFTANDGADDSNAATVSITVTPENDAPVAGAQSVMTAEDTAVSVTLAASDVDLDVLAYSLATDPGHGTVTGTGTARTYIPDPNYHGPDSFTFKANDGTSDSALATVSITVTPVLDAPTATPASTTVLEDSSVAVTLAASDDDGDVLTYSIVSGPTHGTLTGTDSARTYTAEGNYHGPDSFTFKANDGTGDSAPATVSITVISVNDTPVSATGSASTAEDTPVPVTLAATDVDSDTLTYSIATGPGHGTLTGTGTARTYTPAANYHGPDSFTFKANDGTIDSVPAAVTLTVTPVNDAPVASTVALTVSEGAAGTITFSASDIDGDTLTYAVVGGSGPASGSLTGSGASRTFTADMGTAGTVGFDYQACDPTTACSVAHATITVTRANRVSVASPQSFTATEGTSVDITLSGSDPDNGPSALVYAIDRQPNIGTLERLANDRYRYRAGGPGEASFDFTASDGAAVSTPATVRITVNAAAVPATPCTSLSLLPNPTSPHLPVGTTVTYTARTAGCPNPVYSFWLQRPGEVWQVVAEGPASSYRLATAGFAAGTYNFAAWVRNAGSTSIEAVNAMPGLVLSNPVPTSCTNGVLNASPSSPHQTVGTNVTFTARTNQCPNPQYRFWLLEPGGSWRVVQEYGSNAGYAFNTAGRAPGTYYVSMWARNAGSSAETETSAGGVGVTLVAPVPTSCTNGVLNASPSSPHQTVGTNVTFTARTSQCPNPQYRFWLLEPGGSWRVVQEYGSSSTFALNTAGRTPGTYYVSMWARNGGSTAETETSAGGVGLTLSRPVAVACTNGLLTPNPSGVNQTVGTTISFQASVQQCPNPQYKFWHLAPGGTWRVVQDYSSASSFALRTAGFATGDHYVAVWVRNAGSTSDTETSAGGVRVRLVRVGASAGSVRTSTADGDALEIPPPVSEDDTPPAPLSENLSLVLPPISGTFSVVELPPGSPGLGTGKLLPAAISGYRLVGADGGVYAFGDAKFFGSTGAMVLNRPIVGMADTPSRQGYWLVASDGGVFTFGDATFFGSTGAVNLNRPIVGMAATPSGQGYWLVASDGGVFTFGDATFFGSTGAVNLNRPIVGMTATPSGQGYWLVASDGGVFTFGDATFFGSTGAVNLNSPIIGIAPARSGNGYLLVASDGGVFTFGDAGFHGSVGTTALNRPVVGVAG